MMAEELEADPDPVQTLPEVPDDGVLIKTLYATHSTQYTADVAGFVGHGICGKVMSLGSKVPVDTRARVGDVVVVYPWPGCGKCETCSTENWQLCDEYGAAAVYSGDGLRSTSPSDGGEDTTSSLAGLQVVVVPQWRRVVSLPRDCDITPDVGCLLPCDALRVYAALRDARSHFDNAVRVRGFANLLVVAGDSVDGLELWTVLLVKNVLCDPNVKVVCASGRRDVVDRALDAGADDAVLLPVDSTLPQLIDAATMSGYNRIDVSFDLAGDATSLTVAVRSLHFGGTLFALVTPSSTGEQGVTLDELVRRGVTLRPVLAGSLEQLHELIDLLAVQRVSVNIPLQYCRHQQLGTVVQRLGQRTTCGRIVIKYD